MKKEKKEKKKTPQKHDVVDFMVEAPRSQKEFTISLPPLEKYEN